MSSKGLPVAGTPDFSTLPSRHRQSLQLELASRIATCPLSSGPLLPLLFFHLLTRQAKIIQQMVVEPAQLIEMDPGSETGGDARVLLL